jgi:hypothetical protein
MRVPIVALCTLIGIAATVPVGPAAAKRPKVSPENLMSVVTPPNKGLANAHPWINLRVRFGQASDGSSPDLATFKARLGRCKLDGESFEDVVENGVIVEKRIRLMEAATRKCTLKLGEKPKNRLKLEVRAATGDGKKSKLRDKDKVRFGIIETENHPPVATIAADQQIIGEDCQSPEGLMVAFSAQEQPDADDDLPIRYEWDFGDGMGASGKTVTHAYKTCDPVTVTLRSYDEDMANGGAEGRDERVLPAVPVLDPFRNAGILRLTAEGTVPLDFGAVPVGQVATATFTVQNDAVGILSQVKFTIETLGDGSPFSTGCPPTAPACTLGPKGTGGDMQVTVTFAPTAPGHAQTVLRLLAAARNRNLLHLVVHGYGGAGPVPWNTSGTAFHLGGFETMIATLPDGTVQTLDVGTGTCEGGSLDGSPCVTNADCGAGAPCGDRVCLGGDQHLTPCSGPSGCPGGTCGEVLDPIDICADRSGAVYIMSDEARFDLNDDRDPPESGMILRAGLDGSRSTVTTKITEESPVIACQPGSGGRIFWANYELYGPDEDEKEALRSVPKTGGTVKKEIDNINVRMGDADPTNYLDPSSDYVYYEPSAALRVTSGGAYYMANFYGLYRLTPTPALLLTRDVTDTFELFPDGSILATAVDENDVEATIRVYKFDPNRAVTGALALSDLRPWATTTIPNNRGACNDPCRRSTFIAGQGVAPDGVVFVNVYTTAGSDELSLNLRARGTLRFEPLGDGSAGTPTGFVNLDILERLMF